MKKKQDKIDGLFKEYFAGGGGKRRIICQEESACFDYSRASVGLSLSALADNDGLQAQVRCPDSGKLGAYIDGSLDKKEADVLEGHIPGCKKCREKVLEVSSAVERFEKRALPEAPQVVSSEELSRLIKKNPRKDLL